MCILWKNRIQWLMESGVEAVMNLQLLESVGKPDQRRVISAHCTFPQIPSEEPIEPYWLPGKVGVGVLLELIIIVEYFRSSVYDSVKSY